ncbi:MAG TPA: hypothetical protein VFB78_00805 [Acidimicrobiales bacterium]|nr:hypothetical protein [Acidimicrobiales bacterium]
MLGRKDYTKDEIATGKKAVADQLAAFKKLRKAAGATADAAETVYFNNMVLVLDRYYVHRIRPVTGKDHNPLNEVELLVDALINNGGVLRGNNVIKLAPEQSVLGLKEGDPIQLNAADFQRLAAAFFEELERKFG